MDRQDQARSWCKALAVTLVLSCAWAAAALGATGSQAECDRIARDLHSFDTPINELSADVVDHMPAGDDSDPQGALDSQAPVRTTAAPLLVLTPRVADILEDVFDSDTAAADEAELPDATRLGQTTEKSAPVTLIDEETGQSRFQRQMYRKDI